MLWTNNHAVLLQIFEHYPNEDVFGLSYPPSHNSILPVLFVRGGCVWHIWNVLLIVFSNTSMSISTSLGPIWRSYVDGIFNLVLYILLGSSGGNVAYYFRPIDHWRAWILRESVDNEHPLVTLGSHDVDLFSRTVPLLTNSPDSLRKI